MTVIPLPIDQPTVAGGIRGLNRFDPRRVSIVWKV
jgi:hypothetical protein